MSNNHMRVRFAPSPTGYLHVGGARTALFNFLLAKKNGGTFVLRIEDTDQDRNKAEHVQAIIDGMHWLGFQADEGPYFQSDNFSTHKRQAIELMTQGHAYPLFGDEFAGDDQRPSRPDIRNRAQLLRFPPPDEDFSIKTKELIRRMREEPFAIVFAVPEGVTEWEDMVHGYMHFDNKDIEDFIILRADGIPLYNMACTSDDIAHRITHVLRGDDHIANTPKQIMLYHALDADVPSFGHLPMILGADGKKMSKRNGVTSVASYGDEGILPEAMVNFLSLLGWNPGDDEEIMSFERIMEKFSPDRIHKKGAIFDMGKLEWMNGMYLKQALPESLCEKLDLVASESNLALVTQLRDRARTISDIQRMSLPFVTNTALVFDPEVVAKTVKNVDNTVAVLNSVSDSIDTLKTSWTPEAIEAHLRYLAITNGIGFGKIVHPLRLALTGTTEGPGIDQTLFILGRERSVDRIRHFVSTIRE